MFCLLFSNSKFSSAANDQWAMSQNDPISVAASRDPTDQGSVSAVSWKGGDRISLFYFNNNNPSDESSP